MSNRTRTIKSLPLIAVLFTCVVLLSSAAIFASEDSSLSSEVSSDFQLVIPEEYQDPVYEKLASGGDVRAVTYTTTDIYNLLSIALYNEGTTNTWSLPRIAYYSHLTSNNANNIYQQIQYLNKALYGGGNSSGFASNFNLLFSLQHDNGTEYVGLADLVADFPALTYASVNQLLGAQQNSNYYLSQINSNLSNRSYNWIDSGSTFNGVSLDFDTNYVSTSQSTSFKVDITFGSSVITSPNCILRLFVPLYTSTDSLISTSSISLGNIRALYNGSYRTLNFSGDYYLEPTLYGTYVYFFNFRPTYSRYIFEFTSSSNMTYYNVNPASLYYISFDSDDYQQLKQAFYQAKAANVQVSMSSDVNRLANYLADPDKIAAEQDSQGVIDDTLDGFTGSGSAAAKGSDIGSMKNISGSVQSGLDTGGSAGDAASVFTNANFWSWFTQSTSDGINNPYPAPTVTQRRGSGDEIPDFISGDHEELENYRNRRDRW